MIGKKEMSIALLALIILQNIMPILDAANIENKQLTNTEAKQTSSVEEKLESKVTTTCGTDEVTGGTYTSVDDIVCVPDPEFKETLNYKINKYRPVDNDITVAEMQAITNIQVGKGGDGARRPLLSDIDSLQGIEYAKNLKTLHLEAYGDTTYLPAQDYSYISELPLTELDIRGDLDQLAVDEIAKITTLKILLIDADKSLETSDLSAWGDLTALTTLNVNNGAIPDISFMSSLTKLTTIGLNDNNIRDFSPLESYYTKIRSFTAIGQNWGVVDQNNITAIAPLDPGVLTAPDGSDLSNALTPAVAIPLVWGLCTEPEPVSRSSINDYGPGIDNRQISGIIGIYACSVPMKVSPTATLDEENVQSKDDLIDLFNVEINNSSFESIDPHKLVPEHTKLTIDDSAVDYSTPGTYDIVLTYDYSDAEGAPMALYQGDQVETVSLTIDNVTPELKTDTDSLVVTKEMTDEELIDAFGATINPSDLDGDGSGDLVINVDQSSVDYTTPGSYPVTFSFVDDDADHTSYSLSVNLKVVDAATIIPIGNESATKAEEIKPLTDSELIDLFNVSSKDSVLGTELPISVDSSSVDYTHPGDYTVTFSVEDSTAGTVSRDTILTLSDIKPEIETGSDSVDVLLGSDKLDYATVFNPSIVGEKELNDNTIVVDDSCSYDGDTYNALGTCTVEFAINDDDSAGTKFTKDLTVNVVDPKDLLVIGNDSATKEEEIKPLTDSELIDLFQVSPIDSELGTDLDISVDSTAVDYNHPGNYKVTFTVANPLGGVISKDVTLTLSNIQPTISTKVDSAEVSVGDNKLDYDSVFDPTITGESVLSDDTITVDDTKVDYNKPGEYVITYSVLDDDAKQSVITRDEKVIVNPKQVTLQSKADKIKMTLATTGLGQTVKILIIAAIVLVILSVLRFKNRRI